LLNVDYGANRLYVHELLDRVKSQVPVEVVKELENYEISMRKNAFLPGEEK